MTNQLLERRTVDLDADLAAPGVSRRFVRNVLSTWEASSLEDVEFVVSELVTNAVVHGEAPIRLVVERRSDRLRIEVVDHGADLPVVREASLTATSGRGLRIIDSLVFRWGVDASVHSKVVWAELRQT